MPDRLVVYKTPLHRVIETSLVLLASFATAEVWQTLLPQVSASYIVVAALLLGFATLPRLGAWLAARRGGLMMTSEERTRRYLSELGPIAAHTRPGQYRPVSSSVGARRYRRG